MAHMLKNPSVHSLFSIVAISASLLTLPIATGANAQALTDPVMVATTTEVHSMAAGAPAAAIAQRLSPLQNAFSLANAPARGQAPTGIAGGDGLAGWAGWGTLSFGRSENTFVGSLSDGNNQTLSLGLDRPISDKVTFGAALAIYHDSTDTIFNGGNTETTSVSLSPYAKFTLNDWLSADVSMGYSTVNTDQMRLVFGAPVTASYDASSYFVSANLDASKWYDTWLISGRLGITASESRRDAFVESNGTANAASTTHLTQASLSGTVGYWTEPFLLYLTGEYINDLHNDAPVVLGASTDSDEFRLTLGTHIYGQGKWKDVSGGFGITQSFGRTDKESTSAVMSLRFEF